MDSGPLGICYGNLLVGTAQDLIIIRKEIILLYCYVGILFFQNEEKFISGAYNKMQDDKFWPTLKKEKNTPRLNFTILKLAGSF